MQTAPEMTQKPANKKEKKKKTVGQEILSWVYSFCIALVVAMLIRTFLFTLITVDGTSMLETLQDGDKLYVSVLSAKLGGYERGDIVICRYPGRKDYIVKRVIALPGDTVSVDQGQVYVNGEALGDNRRVSHDSHSSDVGPVTTIIGKVRAIFWPLNRIGRVQ